MKQRLSLMLLLTICAILPLAAQYLPQGFNYQCIIRDNNNAVIANQTVTLLFSIRSGAPNGPVGYSEKQTSSTNEFGLINLVVGQGTPLQNTFADVNWGGGPKYLTISLEVSPSVFESIGDAQLMSVPYALYAGGTSSTGGDNWGSQTVQTNPTLVGNGTVANPIALAQQGAQAGQVMKWNGTGWQPAVDDIGNTNGTVTQINTGNGLQGGPITSSGTIGLTTPLSNPGTYGSAAQIPIISVNNEGRITSIQTVFVGTNVNVSIVGGPGITTSQNGSIFTVNNTGDTNASDDLTQGTTFNGDVSGAYNALEIKANVVGSNEIADNAVTSSELAPNSVTSSEIATEAVTASKLADMGASNGQVLKWNGSNWAPAADASGPTVSLTGLAGISITGSSPNFSIQNTGDTDATNDVTTTTAANGDVSGVFSNLQIKADVITTSELANNAVETANLLDDAVTAAKIDDMGATNGQILKWNGTNWAPAADQTGGGGNTVQAGSGIDVDLAGTVYTINNTGDTDATNDVTTTTTANGDVSGVFSNLQIKADVITTSELANNAVETANVANGAITAAKIDDMSATTGQVLKWNGTAWAPGTDLNSGTGGGSVDIIGGTGIGVVLSGTTYTITNLGDTNAGDDLTTATVANGDVSGVFSNLQIKADVVTTSELANNAVETANILDDAVTPAKIDDMNATTGQVIKWNGTNWAAADDEVATAGTGDNWGTQVVNTTPILDGDGTPASPITLSQQGATTGQVLRWDGTSWTPGTATGDNWGTQTVSTNATMTGIGTAANQLRIAQQGATTGQVLRWNGTTWLPATLSGDNWGTQTVAVNATLTGNGTTANQLRLAQQGATTGQVLKWSGTTWLPQNDNAGTGGGITFTAGAGIDIASTGASTATITNIGDLDKTNELQDLTLAGTILGITDGNTVDLAPLLAGSGTFWMGSTNIQNTNTGTVSIGGPATGTAKLQVFGNPAGPAAFFSSATGPSLITGAGNVGINNNAPAYTLDVKGEGHFVSSTVAPALVVEQSGTAPATIGFASAGSAGTWQISAKGGGEFNIINSPSTSKVFNISNAGNIGLGMSNTNGSRLLVSHLGLGLSLQHSTTGYTWDFAVDGTDNTLKLFNTTSPALAVGTFATNGLYTPSDSRLKRDVLGLNDQVIQKIMQLNAVSYNYKNDADNAKRSIGFLAQNVQSLFPELVIDNESRDGSGKFLALNYAGFGVLAIKAVQEQQKEIEGLKKENADLQKRMQNFERRLLEVEQVKQKKD